MDIQIAFHTTGGPEVLNVEPFETREPDAHEIRVRHHAIGVNFVDIYYRTGLYKPPDLPSAPGVEAAGIVEAVGADVTDIKPGDRIAYAGLPIGSYATSRLLPAKLAIALPDDISLETAAASMLRGLTVHMLTNRIFPPLEGKTILIHAAAGGLGQYLTRWAKHLGATVIGTVSSEEKAERAKQAGADHVVVGRDTDLTQSINDLTGGRGVDLIADGVGGAKFLSNFEIVAPFGVVASLGQPAGDLPLVPPSALSARSASFARPSVMAYISNPDVYRNAAAEVIQMMQSGIQASIGNRYALNDAAQAHSDMETGKTAGSLLLIP